MLGCSKTCPSSNLSKVSSRSSFQPAATPQRPRQKCLTTAMAKPSKAADLRSLSEEDIEAQIYDCQRALLDMRIAQKWRKAFKADQFGWNKNKIAQLKMILREREIDQGINCRESKKLEKQKKLAAGFGRF